MLTLSIAEAKPGEQEFEINCFCLRPRIWKAEIVSFSRTKEEIFDIYGQPLWDIGKISILSDYAKKQEEPNPVYIPTGEVRLSDKEVTHETLREYLENNKIPYSEFKNNQSLHFAIVIPRQLVSIEEDDGVDRKQRLVLDFDDNHRQETLLNKDYRWVHYWRQIPADGVWEKQDGYRDYLNQPGKRLYLVLHRFIFIKKQDNKNERIWISGMHWL